MFRLATLIVVLFFMQITPTTCTLDPIIESRIIRIPRVVYEPCQGEAVGRFVQNRYACDKFFYCAPNGLAIPVDCPHGMIFNNEKEICDFPTNYLCIPERMKEDHQKNPEEELLKTSTRPPIYPAISGDRCPTDDPGGIVFLANKNECNRYYICYHGNPIPQECIKELHWNTKLERCDFPENAGCLVTTATPLSTSVAPVAVTITCPFRGEQVFPHPEECNYFIYCVNGYATVQQCPFFHHYDVQSKTCKWQTLAKCIVQGKDSAKSVKRP